MAYTTGVLRGVSAASGLLGLAITIVSAIFLAQSLGYRDELGYIFGYQLPNIGTNYNRYSYNVLGYEVDPLIGISAGGIVVGILQLISCFFLCCARRNLTMGWAVASVIILIGVIVCFAIGIYFQVYSRKILPGYGALGLGGHGSAGIYGNSPSLGFQNSFYNGGIGNHLGNYDSRFSGDYLCNPTGQAYCAMLGIDMVFLIVALLAVGSAARNLDKYNDQMSVQKGYNGDHNMSKASKGHP